MFSFIRALYRHHRQLAVIGSLVFATGLCLALLFLRLLYTRSFSYATFGWNLFLAWMPLVCALAAYNVYKQPSRLSWLVVAGCTAVWLVFFPNAPYLVTDIAHLAPAPGMPFWYDLIMVSAFAWTGLFLGLVSLYLMQALIRQAAGGPASWLFALGVSGLSGFGIYLGRFLRWNSWDLLINPLSLLADVAERLRHPFAHYQTFIFSALFSLFFVSAYLMLAAMMQLRQEPAAVRGRRPEVGSQRKQ
jgi:uncharacterized membrane protein